MQVSFAGGASGNILDKLSLVMCIYYSALFYEMQVAACQETSASIFGT